MMYGIDAEDEHNEHLVASEDAITNILSATDLAALVVDIFPWCWVVSCFYLKMD